MASTLCPEFRIDARISLGSRRKLLSGKENEFDVQIIWNRQSVYQKVLPKRDFNILQETNNMVSCDAKLSHVIFHSNETFFLR